MGRFSKPRLITWYAEHIDGIALLYLIPIGLSWYFYFQPTDQQYHTLVVVGAMFSLYHYVKRKFRRFCYSLIHQSTVDFTKDPKIEGVTSEDLLDSFDKEILENIDELREEKGDYLALISALSDLMDPQELFLRLGKLRALNLVRARPSRISLTPSGLEALSSPTTRVAKVPQKYSYRLAKARIDFDDGNFSGVSDDINILFEDILKDSLKKRFGDALNDEWKKLQKDNKVRPDLERANLGALHRACRDIGVIDPGSKFDHILFTFLDIRNPAKHLSAQKIEPAIDAETALDIAGIFTRHWFE